MQFSLLRKSFFDFPPLTLRKWYNCVDGSPGFIAEAITALKNKAAQAEREGTKLKCGLIVDEMSIGKHIEWDTTKFSGCVDMGAELDDDELPVAKDALVFLVNSLNGNWKVPVAYFLINGLTTPERANLISEALSYIHKTGVDIVSITFDGTSTNISSANELGTNISADNLKHYFPHPVTKEPVYVVLDACHMLKLVRNCLASKGSLFNGIANASGKLQIPRIMQRLILHGLNEVMTRRIDVFNSLDAHSLDHSPQDNHKLFPVKAVFFKYLKIRFTHVGKTITQELQANNTWSINSKATLFMGH